MPERRPVILACNTVQWPGNDASGVNQSLPGLAMALQDQFDFKFLSRDRPFGATHPVAEAGSWQSLAAGQIHYLAPTRTGLKGLRALVTQTPHDLLYLNGFFDRWFTLPLLVMRRLGLIERVPTILSPRGEFSTGALGLKSGQKAAYIGAARSFGLLGDVVLHGTSDAETSDIQAGFPWAGGYATSANVRPLPALPDATLSDRSAPGVDGPQSGPLRLVFVGRISPVKNLDFALAALAKVETPVVFDIYGPLEHPAYVEECRRQIRALPAHVSATLHGQIDAVGVQAALSACDLFFMPSKSENFGHSIFEALANGVPVLIGDQTPWTNLADRQAGWDLPLTDARAFAKAITAMAGLPPLRRAALIAGARAAAVEWTVSSNSTKKAADMFRAVLDTDMFHKDKVQRITTHE
jgi:glycosyltransferase involved in cell wall biosynthesis